MKFLIIIFCVFLSCNYNQKKFNKQNLDLNSNQIEQKKRKSITDTSVLKLNYKDMKSREMIKWTDEYMNGGLNVLGERLYDGEICYEKNINQNILIKILRLSGDNLDNFFLMTCFNDSILIDITSLHVGYIPDFIEENDSLSIVEETESVEFNFINDTTLKVKEIIYNETYILDSSFRLNKPNRYSEYYINYKSGIISTNKISEF